MDNRYIGVFDSGLGGLTTVKQIMECMPDERIIYFGDTGRVPYGSRGRDTIVKYVRGDIRFLLGMDVKLIVAACGTASAVALPQLEKESDIPLMGVLGPAVNAALCATRNNKIGIIGTAGTIKSGAYERIIKENSTHISTFSKSCPLFVPLVENGHCESKVAELIVEEYLEDMKRAEVDTLILGCTHYPHLAKTINKFMGDGVTLIDPGRETAIKLSAYMKENGLEADGSTVGNKYRYYVSDNPEGFSELAGRFLETTIDERVDLVDIEKY